MIKLVVALMLVSNAGFTEIPKQNEIYQINAIVRNFTTKTTYSDGETWYTQGFEFTDTNGRRWVQELRNEVMVDWTSFILSVDAKKCGTFKDDVLVGWEVVK